jgi:phosphopantetheinyl transferase
MPLLLKRTLVNNAHLGIWNVLENEAYFLQQLDLQPVEREELAALKGHRRIEWLASRYLVHDMLLDHGSEDRIPVLKDSYGKPHIWDSPFHLSFSHSHEMVAVMLAESLTGIDIQKFVSKIGSLAHRFLREEELNSLREQTRLEHLHFYWCAKEALFKAHGRRQVDFRQHLWVEPFDYGEIVTTTGIVHKENPVEHYKLWFEKIGDYFLAYCIGQ